MAFVPSIPPHTSSFSAVSSLSKPLPRSNNIFAPVSSPAPRVCIRAPISAVSSSTTSLSSSSSPSASASAPTSSKPVGVIYQAIFLGVPDPRFPTTLLVNFRGRDTLISLPFLSPSSNLPVPASLFPPPNADILLEFTNPPSSSSEPALSISAFVWYDGVDVGDRLLSHAVVDYNLCLGPAPHSSTHARYIQHARVINDGAHVSHVREFRRLKFVDPSLLHVSHDVDFRTIVTGKHGDFVTLFGTVCDVFTVPGLGVVLKLATHSTTTLSDSINVAIPTTTTERYDGFKGTCVYVSGYIVRLYDQDRGTVAIAAGTPHSVRIATDKPCSAVRPSLSTASLTLFSKMDTPTFIPRIVAVYPKPNTAVGEREAVRISCVNDTPITQAMLDGWKLRDGSGATKQVAVQTEGEQYVDVQVGKGTFYLNDSGDQLWLMDKEGRVVDFVEYEASEVEQGKWIEHVKRI